MHKRFSQYIDFLIISSKPKRVKPGAGRMSISHGIRDGKAGALDER